jgi:uncharacterized protein (TIRG00374 family)
MLLAYSNWLLDCAALHASLHAVQASVPARSIVIVYVLAQLVANVSLLPGGGGTVELTLATGFAAFSHHAGSMLAGVVLYRFVACWGLIPIGWCGFILEQRAAGRSAPGERGRTPRARPLKGSDRESCDLPRSRM